MSDTNNLEMARWDVPLSGRSVFDDSAEAAKSILADLPPMFDTPTLAKVLALSPQRLVDMRHQKTGPAWYRIGRSVRYSRDAVAAWLSQNQFMKA